MQGNVRSLGWIALMGLLLLGALIVAACDDDDDSDGGPTDVRVSLDEWSIEPDVSSVRAGKITFIADNIGKAEHELVIVRTDLAPDALPVAGGKADEDAAGEEIGEIEEFPAGETERGTFTLEAGTYVLLCNIAGHYELGMTTAFTVN